MYLTNQFLNDRNTIQGDLKVKPAVWSKLGDEAKGMLTSLLNKSRSERITAREALRHSFFVLHPPTNRHTENGRHKVNKVSRVRSNTHNGKVKKNGRAGAISPVNTNGGSGTLPPVPASTATPVTSESSRNSSVDAKEVLS